MAVLLRCASKQRSTGRPRAPPSEARIKTRAVNTDYDVIVLGAGAADEYWMDHAELANVDAGSR